MSLDAGARLGPYQIVSPLGSGGMGQVYRARDPRLGRDVAIKVLPPDVASDPERLSRFNDEARATAALNHPNILAVFDVGDDSGITYLVSEVLDGQTLRELIAAETIAVGRAMDLAAQVAEGLSAAHARGIVHRDLKPENIFVTNDGRAKILDFGLAKLAEPSMPGTVETRMSTAPHVLLGSIGYMSPEQVRGLPADHRSDIFSFGCVLYEMLAGHRAFDGASVQDWMVAVTRDAPAPLVSTASRPYSPILLRVVDRCLEKSPAARFQSTTDLAFALRSLAQGQSAVTSGLLAMDGRTEEGHTPLDGSPASAAARWQLIPWLVSAVAIATAAVVLWRSQPGPTPPSRLYHLVIGGNGQPFRTGSNWSMFVISADGTKVVYSLIPPGGRAGAAGGTSGPLYVRRLDEANPKPIPGTEGAVRPMISPDGQWVAFTDTTNSIIKKIPIDGGTPTVVATNVTAGGAWAADGTLILGRISGGGLARVATTGGPVTPIVLPAESPLNYSHPQPLPDGSILVTIVQPRQSKVGVLPAGATTVKAVVDGMHPRFVAPNILVFARGSTLMAATFDLDRHELTSEPVSVLEGVLGDVTGGQSNFDLSADGTIAFIPGGTYGELAATSFVVMDRSGNNEQALAFRPQAYRAGRLSPDGSLLMTAAVTGESDQLLVGDVARGTLTPITADPVTAYEWSRDGRRVDYRKGDGTMWTRPADLSAPESRLADRERPGGPGLGVLSPDGRWRVMTRPDAGDGKTGSDIWLIDESPENAPPRRLIQNAENDDALALSPDGRWLLYSTENPGGSPPNRRELYVQPFPGPGRVTSFTPDGVRLPVRWAGGEIFFRSLGGGTTSTIMAAHVTTGTNVTADAPAAVLSVQASYTWDDVTRDGRRFLFRKDLAVASDATPATELHVIVNWLTHVNARLAGVLRDE